MSFNLEPLVILTVLAVMGVAASLTFAAWREITRPTAGTSFDKALEAVQRGSELTTEDVALREDDTKSDWSWNKWWADALHKTGRENVDPTGFGRTMLGVVIISLVFGILVFPTGFGAVLVPLVAVGVVRAWIAMDASKRRRTLDKQLPILLSALRTQIHAGQTVQAAIMVIAEDMPSPLGDEMRRVRDQVNVSVPLEIALEDMSERTGSRLVQFLVASIGIAIKSGSDLVPQLITIEEIVRQRARIAGKIRSAVALAKPTSYLALAAPPAMFLWMTFASPGFLDFFLSDGLLYLFIAIVLYVAGAVWVRLMVSNVDKI